MSDSALRVPDVLARPTDPQTSHQAPTGKRLSRLKIIVLGILANEGADTGMTDSAIDEYYAKHWITNDWPYARFETPRKRRSELANAGYVRDTGHTLPNIFGSDETVWEITPAGVAALDRSKK